MKAGSLNKSQIIFGCLHTVMSQQSPSNDQFKFKAIDNTIENQGGSKNSKQQIRNSYSENKNLKDPFEQLY